MLTSIGSAGIGLVWGWLWGMWLVLRADGRQSNGRTLLILLFSTTLLGLLVWWLADGRALAWWGATAVLALFAHFAWREYLTDKVNEKREP